MRASLKWCSTPWVELRVSGWHKDFLPCLKEACPLLAWDRERKVWLLPADKVEAVTELLESFGAGDLVVTGHRLEVAMGGG